jgi:dTDP-glucose 4,6-dehydratase
VVVSTSPRIKLKFQRYAVIGSNSFAGAVFIARAIADGADVIGFNRSPETSPIFLPYHTGEGASRYRFFQADINHDLDAILTSLDEFSPQVVVDFAGQGMVAESWKNPEQWYTTNIVAKVRFHDQLRRRTWLHRYIRISTPEVYGSQGNLANENWQYNPSTPYAVSHASIDMSLRAFQQQYNFPVIFTRFANFYGPGQQLYRILPRTIIYALSGNKLQLHGGGTSIRAFIYGADVADGIMRTINKGTVGEVYHFSPERFLTIRQVVEIICQQMGVDFDELAELAPERPGKDMAYLMNSSKARTELDWKESVSFEQGINATVEWVKASFDEIRTLPLDYIHKT